MQRKMNGVAVAFDKAAIDAMGMIRLGEMSQVTGGVVEGAPALIFHKKLDSGSPTYREDFQNPENVVIVRFGNPQQIDVLLSALDRALAPFVDEDVKIDVKSLSQMHPLN